jgi:hypothetical protein
MICYANAPSAKSLTVISDLRTQRNRRTSKQTTVPDDSKNLRYLLFAEALRAEVGRVIRSKYFVQDYPTVRAGTLQPQARCVNVAHAPNTASTSHAKTSCRINAQER